MHTSDNDVEGDDEYSPTSTNESDSHNSNNQDMVVEVKNVLILF